MGVSGFIDAMDQIVAVEVTQNVNVETEDQGKLKPKVGVKVETKWCFVKLVKLDSILFDNEPEVSAPAPEKESASKDTINSLPRLCPKNWKNWTTRHPRGASNNIQYEEAEDEGFPVAKHTTGYVRNIKPYAAGPSAACVWAQSTSSVPPSSSLPGLTAPVIDPYDADTEIDSDVQVETSHDDASKPNKSPTKKGSISITSHTLKTTTMSRKYKCKICGDRVNSVKELTIHHQTKHHILYCSMCRKVFNNPLSLARHKYEHKHHDHKCPKCDRTFAFESQVKPICSHITRTPVSSVYILDVPMHSSKK